MARYTGTVDAPHSAEEVWHYLADLRSIGEWDPSVESVTLVDGEPRTEGARYELDVRFPRQQHHASPTGSSRRTRPAGWCSELKRTRSSVRDEARIEPAGDGASRVTWDAELRLRGIRKMLDLPLRAFFNRLGQDARNAGWASGSASPHSMGPAPRCAA